MVFPHAMLPEEVFADNLDSGSVSCVRARAGHARLNIHITIESNSMTSDPFKAPWNTRSIMSVAFIFTLLALVLTIQYYPGSPRARTVLGVVRSSGAVAASGVNGGVREVATIKLVDGNVVLADVLSGGPLSAGDAVTVLAQPHMFGMPSYEVVVKNNH